MADPVDILRDGGLLSAEEIADIGDDAVIVFAVGHRGAEGEAVIRGLSLATLLALIEDRLAE